MGGDTLNPIGTYNDTLCIFLCGANVAHRGRLNATGPGESIAA